MTKLLTKSSLESLMGYYPENETKYKKDLRLHQAWWRMFVLNQQPGAHPITKGSNVCNTIRDGRDSELNFLNNTIRDVVKKTLVSRDEESGGKIEEERLYNNLLSSQPLCFNFFAEFEEDNLLGLSVIQSFWPEVTALNEVLFEYSPPENYTKDGSAFDIAFDVSIGDKRGLFGVECKYTDPFSFKPQKSKIPYGDIGNKNHDTYKDVFSTNEKSFLTDYYSFVKDKDINQLFRNELMKVSMVQNNKFDEVKTALFCHQNDSSAIASGKKLQSLLKDGEYGFVIMTYSDIIEAIQKQELSWEQREWSMMLWARYCGLQLSESVLQEL